jgi:hypothetical protein
VEVTGTVSTRVKARRRIRTTTTPEVIIRKGEIYGDIIWKWTRLGSLTEFGFLVIFAKMAFGKYQNFRERIVLSDSE